MARPRKDQEGPSALERMRTAFWQLIEEVPYSSISVRLIAQRAGVNHNTIYYYFDGIDDMAMSFLRDNIPEELAQVVASMAAGKGFDVTELSRKPDMPLRFRRMRLIVRNASPSFMGMAKGQVAKIWVGMLGVSLEELTGSDWAKFNFIWGGITSVMASEEITCFEDYCSYLQDGIAGCVDDLAYKVSEAHEMVCSQDVSE